MAKVSKIKIEVGDKTHEFDVHFSEKLQFHIKNFPSEILSVTAEWGGAIERKDRLVDLENSVRDLLKEYYERISAKRKVIIYNLNFSQNFTMKRTGVDSWCGTNPEIKVPTPFNMMKFGSRKTNDKGYGLIFDFSVATEVTGSETKYLRQWKKDNGELEMEQYPSRAEKDEAVIDWTPEREAFFENMKDAMTKMAIKFCDFFGQDEKKLLNIMDSGTKLLS